MALTVREYLTAEGKSPFREWLDSLTVAVRARISRAQSFWSDYLEAKRHGKAK